MDPISAAIWGLFFLEDTRRGIDTVADKLTGIVTPKPDSMDVLARAYAHYIGEGAPGSPLESKFDKLALICMSIWELLRDKHGLSNEDLLNKTREIDLRDGVPDGKITILPKKCLQCGRTVSPRHTRCMYCGSEELEAKPLTSTEDAGE